MIVSVDEVISLPEFQGMDAQVIQNRLDALEVLIREHTNNNFQNRNIRFLASSSSDRINGVSPFLRVGDTIQISESMVNDGLYVITAINDEHILIDKEIFEVPRNLVTKVEYPMDVKQGIINLMKWEQTIRNKVGIKSETISRHSVTYYDQDKNNQVMGYPVSLLGFLDSYMKARF
jgi:uncharacterized protein (UPF0147 family)